MQNYFQALDGLVFMQVKNCWFDVDLLFLMLLLFCTFWQLFRVERTGMF